MIVPFTPGTGIDLIARTVGARLGERLSGDGPFCPIDDLINQEELRRMSNEYKRIAGFALDKEMDADQVRHDACHCGLDPQSDLSLRA